MVVHKWTRREVRALRDALRLTQEKFGEKIGYNPETVAKWERATRERPVRGDSAKDLDTVLARLDGDQKALFDLALNESDAQSSGRADSTSIRIPDSAEDDVNRREFGRMTATVAMAITMPDNHSRIGMSDVHRLLAAVDEFDRRDQLGGGPILASLATTALEEAKERLETGAFDVAAGKAFTSATGELAVLAGWLAYDADCQADARRCYADAMSLAAEADDTDLMAHTCLYVASQSVRLAREGRGAPFKALRLADRAQDLMRGRPPGRIHALIAVRAAQAHALLGNRSDFGRTIATAWRELDHAVQFEPIDQVPQWLRFVTHSEIADHEAHGYADLGDLRRSVELYSRAVEHPMAIRNSTVVRAWSATMRARLGDLTGALEHGLSVLEDVSTMSSTRALRRLEPVRAAVAGSADGAEFCDMFDTLDRKAPNA